MGDSTQNQLRFPAIAGFSVRADFEGGALSSDFGPLLLRGIERQCGLIDRLALAIHDRRHPSYIEHSVVDLLRQRMRAGSTARDLLIERTQAGLERAKSEGKALGRPAATGAEQVQALKAEGKSQSEVAAQLKVSLSTVKRLWNKAA